MNIALGCLASGSSGNCYLIKTETTNLLVDAGISGKQIFERLQNYSVCGVPDAVLVTHEHSDHIQGVPALIKKGARFYATQKTFEAIKGKDNQGPDANVFTRGDAFAIGDIQISSFAVSHDAADPCGFSFFANGKCISIITDTGYVTPVCYKYMQKADLLVLESNHDESMLRIGRYPWFLKQRILSDKGHLSNEAAAKALADVLKLDDLSGKIKKRQVLLAHLSKENNFPKMAMITVNNVLEEAGFAAGKDVLIDTLSRTEQSPLYIL